jgi:hypothetical protein
MNKPLPGQSSRNDDDREMLVLTFITEYQAFERALVLAGFTTAGRTPGNARPDWARFVRTIERKFHSGASPELLEAAYYLLEHPDYQDARWERMENAELSDPYSPQRDIIWLSEMVQQIGNKLARGFNLMGQQADYDLQDITAAMLVVEAWSHIDPKVERLLGHVQ